MGQSVSGLEIIILFFVCLLDWTPLAKKEGGAFQLGKQQIAIPEKK